MGHDSADADIHVHYGFVVLTDADRQWDLLAGRAGQENGLCGAAQPGVLSLVTGLHTGAVPVRLECLAGEPALDAGWEDVVEVSFTTEHADLSMQTFDNGFDLRLPAAGTYRVRYCACGMDPAHDADVRQAGEPALDRYLLQLWPAPAAADSVVRATSEAAAYWHAQALQAPPGASPAATQALAAPTPTGSGPPDPELVALLRRQALAAQEPESPSPSG